MMYFVKADHLCISWAATAYQLELVLLCTETGW